jgi:hypothetical protein
MSRSVHEFIVDGPIVTPREWRALLNRDHFAGTVDMICADGRDRPHPPSRRHGQGGLALACAGGGQDAGRGPLLARGGVINPIGAMPAERRAVSIRGLLER